MKVFKTKGSAILTTIFLLFGILTIAVIGLEIIMSGLSARRAQGASARAFWAAETGIERGAMAFKSFNASEALFNNCVSAGADTASGAYLKFCNTADCETINFGEVSCSNITNPANKTVYHLGGDLTMPSYWVKVNITGRDVALTSQGNFLTTGRQIYAKFCLPTCFGKGTDVDDGCGGKCK